MKIFITGTTGFLGRSLKEHFELNNEVIEYIRGSDIVMALEASKPELIIHCAGEIYNADLMYRTNVLLVNEILEWVRRNPTTRMIQIGSSSEYGPVSRPTNETDPINPQNVYEATKGAATLMCQGYAKQFNLQICVARIYSGYGPHERSHRLFPRLYRAFFCNEPMKLYDGVHDFIYIDDFVRGIDILVNSSWPAGEIVNFGSGIQYRNREVLEAWERVTGRKGPVEYIDHFSKPHDTDFWCCDTSYAKMQYKFQ
jgi:nucleoside-diphosphate-sugar epimerase